MNKGKIVAIFLGILIVTSSCSIFRKNKVPTEAKEYKEIRKVIVAANLDYEYLSAKARVSAKLGDNTQSITVNFRMQKDQNIWASVSAFSIEVARILMTPDSISILNRFKNEYSTQPFSYLSEFTEAEITFDQLQAILLGDIPKSFAQDSKISTSEIGYALSGQFQEYQYLVNCSKTSLKPELFNINSEAKKLNFLATYTDFETLSNTLVANSVLIVTKSAEGDAEINISFSRIELEEDLTFPFKIPSKYERVN